MKILREIRPEGSTSGQIRFSRKAIIGSLAPICNEADKSTADKDYKFGFAAVGFADLS